MYIDSWVVFGVAEFTHPDTKTPPFGEEGIPSDIPPQTPVPRIGIGEFHESKVPTPFSQPAAVTLLLKALSDATDEADSKEPSAPKSNAKLHNSSSSNTPSLSSSISNTSVIPSPSVSVQALIEANKA